ncbi:ATP-dependent RNA helicase suv3, mitochondrial [Madurella mycetomatis]|uniref:RNA helicase n=1 Tax=Madurella mycetomatis TaxID=100816 RepID=A0A175W6H8_9PEZI|nr:ATP-dependent RNA helicase suv3, mitochondrial [Madurella mycetomatis]KXX79175.1 ATP-dependent RNA helicase suv3, mitochondrial [Madurella mycetomatis]
MKSLLGTAWKPPKSVVRVTRRWRSKPKPKPKPRPVDNPPSHRYPNPSIHGLRQDFKDEDGVRRRVPSAGTQRNYRLFQNLIEMRFGNVLTDMGPWSQAQDEYRSFGVTSQAQLDRETALFKLVVNKAFHLAAFEGKTGRQQNPLFWNLRNAFVRSDSSGLAREIKYAFQTFLMRSRFPATVGQLHQELADLRFPYEWYPATRMMQRTIHLHVGPTNSGKTYHALKALENARTGIYAGPLRLLAHEIWSRFTAKGKACALITGEEQRIPEGVDNWFHSCTVEMAPLNTKVDVAVIDEIQMIASDDRGFAWTQALLGIQAKEVHLCGEERVVHLIQALCARMGEQCIVQRYQRLNPLEVAEESLDGNFANLQKGDAVVSFTRVGLHVLKKGIEQATGRRCAIVYGSLPPETRASQAALFNDPNNDYDYLVASDAIGMGLNLEIKRVIFESSSKFDGVGHRLLNVPEIKQIGGRAGRYRTAAQEISGTESKPVPGVVTALDDEDLLVVQKAFETEAAQIETAGVFPPPAVIERFHSYFPPRTPTTFVLARLREMARLSDWFQLCDFRVAFDIADAIQKYDLSISDRCVFLHVPINFKDENQVEALKAFAKCVAEMGSGHLLDFDEIDLDVLEAPRPTTAAEQGQHLHRLESLHMIITMYLWLSYRYQGVFQSQNLAFRVKEMVEAKINEHLENVSFVPEIQRYRRHKMRMLAAEQEQKEKQFLGTDEAGTARPVHNEEGHDEPLFGQTETVDAIQQPGGEMAPGTRSETASVAGQ